MRLGSQGAGRHQRKIVHLHREYLEAQGSSLKTNPVKNNSYMYIIRHYSSTMRIETSSGVANFNWLTVVVFFKAVKFTLKFCIP